MKKVGIYVRVSAQGDREEERFHSPKEQAERAAALATAKGFMPGPVFTDINVSGATAPEKRPAMSQLLEAVQRGELAGIAAFSLDRLSREPAHGDAMVKKVTKAGGVLLTPDIPDAIDSPTGEFTFGMLLQVAKLYRSQSAARFESAKARAIRAGIPVGNVPIGYRQGDDRRLEVDPELAPTIRELFELRARGLSWAKLADHLGERLGRSLPKQTIARIVGNRTYLGYLEYGGYVTDEENRFEAIVDEATFAAAQIEPIRNDRRPGKAGRTWYLTGLVRCEGCDHLMEPTTSGKSMRYRCSNRACTAKVSVDALKATSIAFGELFDRHDDLIGSWTDAEDKALPLEAQLEKAEARLTQARTEEAQDALGDAWASTVKDRRAARDAALAELSEARMAAGTTGGQPMPLRNVWDDLTKEQRRAALQWTFEKIVAHKTERGAEPSLTFVERTGRPPFRIEIEPATVKEAS
jgi:DNA invertase Pin-like site-specific DNA recombinase